MTLAPAPVCPICGSSMRYFAANGKWVGDFWGCSQFSKTGCRGKINVEPDETAPEAGASAQDRFERERAAYRSAQRAKLPLMVAVTFVLMATAFFGVAPFNAWIGAGLALAAGIACLVLIIRLPVEAKYWEKGAAGEKRTAQHLEPLTKRGFVVLHDRRIPMGRGNIDHIAIGGSGVYVVETKYLSGAIDITEGRLFVRDRDRQGYVEQLYREAVGVQIALSDVLN